MTTSAISRVTADELDAAPALAAALLALNNANAVELSFLSAAQLRHLVDQAFWSGRIGGGEALLLAFDQDADYDSPNFLWFRQRYPRFVYVDRIVVAAEARGRGHARCLYVDLVARASLAGHARVVCEVNSEPPNPASAAFHSEFGFVEVGTAAIHGATKRVSYLEKRLD